MGIASALVLSAIFCIWLAGMLRAGSAPDPWPVDANPESTSPGSSDRRFRRARFFSSPHEPPAELPSNTRGSVAAP